MSQSRFENWVAPVFAAEVSFDLEKNPGKNHPVQLAAIANEGKALFDADLAICHGANGIGNEGPSLVNHPYVRITGRQAVMSTIKYGRACVGMPVWQDSLTDTQIQMLTDVLQGLQ